MISHTPSNYYFLLATYRLLLTTYLLDQPDALERWPPLLLQPEQQRAALDLTRLGCRLPVVHQTRHRLLRLVRLRLRVGVGVGVGMRVRGEGWG